MDIEKIRNIGLDKLITQVYDFDSLTTDELLCKFAQKINIIIEHLKYIDDRSYNSDKAIEEKLEYLLGQGLEEQVANELLKEINDGTIGKLINENLLNNINEKTNMVLSIEDLLRDISNGGITQIRWVGDSISVGHDATGAEPNPDGEIIFNYGTFLYIYII